MTCQEPHGFCRYFRPELRNGPEPLPPELVQWLYDGNGRAIFTSTRAMQQAFDRETPAGQTTGAIHHVALDCSDHLKFVERLKANTIEHRLNDIPSIQLKQVFFCEPNGVLLELNFRGE